VIRQLFGYCSKAEWWCRGSGEVKGAVSKELKMGSVTDNWQLGDKRGRQQRLLLSCI